MRILISNDDGYRAPGLVALAAALRTLGPVTVVAPEANRSGASNALTLDRPLRISPMGNEVFAVDGTPADCVFLALTEVLTERPTLVVSGINAGENLGDDVIYSGTVAAAMEGSLMGVPALALSFASQDPHDFEPAALLARSLVQHCLQSLPPRPTLLNVNIPEGRHLDLRQARITRLGRRRREAVAIRQQDPRGRPVYWIGPPGGPGDDAGAGTDFHAIADGCVSITPLQTDLSAYGCIDELVNWLGHRRA